MAPTQRPSIHEEHAPAREKRLTRTGQRQPRGSRPKQQWAPLTPALAFQLAAPQTWVATIAAVTFSFTYATIAYSGTVSLLNTAILFVICVLMQSAVNSFDDYFDYKKGTDTLENSSADKFDAVLVYNKVNPKAVLALSIGFLAVAGLLGLYIVYVSGWVPLAIGLVGAVVVVLYSAGKTPLSHLPIGEFLSGFVMGGLIPLACCYVLSGVFDLAVLVYALPIICGIGMINATNNTCDIEKDLAVERETLPVLLGREKAVKTYRRGLGVWIALYCIPVIIGHTAGAPFLICMGLAAFPVLRALLNNPLIQQSRDGAMAQIVSLNAIFAGFYCLCLAIAPALTWI